MDRSNFLDNILLLVVGGNDTTRNSISGGLLALNRFPDQYRKLRDDPALIDNMVPEIIRWQTPVSYMRRTALRDVEFGGKNIRKGDKVLMWYASGNRDEEVFDRADDFIVDRRTPGTTSPSVSASTAASACVSPRCNCACSGRKS